MLARLLALLEAGEADKFARSAEVDVAGRAAAARTGRARARHHVARACVQGSEQQMQDLNRWPARSQAGSSEEGAEREAQVELAARSVFRALARSRSSFITSCDRADRSHLSRAGEEQGRTATCERRCFLSRYADAA